jgi:hypothetical protein
MKITKEKWADICDYGDLYEISESGIVRNKQRQKILKSHLSSDGYPSVSLNFKGKRTTFRIHRLVYLAFNPNTPRHLTIHHLDHNKLNNHISNLGVIDKRSHSSMHARERVAKGTWNLADPKYYNKPGRESFSYGGKDIVAICKNTNIIKGIFAGSRALESYGLHTSSVYQVISGKRKTHKNLFFKKVPPSFPHKVGEIFSE